MGPEPRSEYTHLFGDVYWRSTASTAAVFLLAFAILFAPFGIWVDTFEGQWRWLLVNYTDLTIWLVQNWDTVGIVLLGVAVGDGLAFNPEFADDGGEG